jgi:hypothetical protein
VLHSYRVYCRKSVQINGLFWIAPAVNLRILDLLYLSTLRVRTCNVKPIIWYLVLPVRHAARHSPVISRLGDRFVWHSSASSGFSWPVKY